MIAVSFKNELDGIDKFKLFKGRTLDIITNTLSNDLCSTFNNNLGNIFLSLIGEGQFANHSDRYDGCESPQMNFVKSYIYKILQKEEKYGTYIYYLKTILSLPLAEQKKIKLAHGIEEAIVFSNLPTVLIKDNDQYYFYLKVLMNLILRL